MRKNVFLKLLFGITIISFAFLGILLYNFIQVLYML
jgi:hypothetical protein